MLRRSIFLAAVLAAAPAACNSEPEPDEPTFGNVEKKVLKPSCVFSSCHAPSTVAARLDLTSEKACNALIEKPSCLFPNRLRIVPGKPDESFFYQKLANVGLDEVPGDNCADKTNFLMPWGAAAISEESLDLVRRWIEDGAKCIPGDIVPEPDDGKPAQITSVSANPPVPVAGVSFTITVTLSKGAPAEGQLLLIKPSDSGGSLSVPAQLVVPAETKEVKFEAYALWPTSRFTLSVETGDPQKGGSQMQLILRIAGLDIAEVLADPDGSDDERQWIKIYNRTTVPIDLGKYGLKAGTSNYDSIAVPLSGMLPPKQCALIGGPKSAGQGAPPYWQTVDFEPDLPHVPGGITGFALFDKLVGIDGITTPVDAMIVGSNNDGRFRGPDGGAPEPYCLTPAREGQSTLRTGPGSTTCVPVATPQPSACPRLP